jgi:hypothetical protein
MRRGLLLGLGLLAVMQLVPVSRTSSGGTVDAVEAPKPVVDVLRKACANCHSQATVWPWYSRIAPVSWLIAHDVNHGREHLDFSTLSSLGARKKAKRFGEIAEEVDEEAMPPWYYRLVHPEARLDEAERRMIIEWANGAQEALAVPTPERKREER